MTSEVWTSLKYVKCGILNGGADGGNPTWCSRLYLFPGSVLLHGLPTLKLKKSSHQIHIIDYICIWYFAKIHLCISLPDLFSLQVLLCVFHDTWYHIIKDIRCHVLSYFFSKFANHQIRHQATHESELSTW